MYVGRFAPSPTGALHFGSLAAALASYLDARAMGGRWLLRIEDIDPPRERPGSADRIRNTLEHLGLHWDGELTRQSERHAHYAEALSTLKSQQRVFPCSCSRAKVAREAVHQTDDGPLYPGTCRPGDTSPAARDSSGKEPVAWRLRVDATPELVTFQDGFQGAQQADPIADVGDFILRRRDGLYAYQLAVAVDDHLQGVTDVVRGVDLLPSTFRQALVLRALGVPTPRYAHIPLAVDAAGHKLSKSASAEAIDAAHKSELLCRALQFLQQAPPRELRRTSPAEVLTWAIKQWNRQPLRGLRAISCEAESI